ncbi:hypothetical protein PHYBOEH_000805 [Phytophthora boehmeriae]|uniref:Uncharacterized protein n=1 Tax=Phytophthora boehmeriae TaxID=109152 RepID=A0A8T1WUA2_9STRA|nr:hypothetical protein PHYBOEH_000805 [Phytophthora boehmeriae]
MKSQTSLQETTTATIEEVQAWSSVVVNDTLKLEHAAVDINTDRVLYHLHLELEHPIPESYLAKAEYLTLTWPVGGIWKIMHHSDNGRVIHCLSWRTTEMNHEDVEELAKKVNDASSASQGKSSTLAASESMDLPSTVFEWKMQLGKWGNNKHWFLRDIMPPEDKENPGANHPGPLTANLMAGFTPLEVQIEVNALTAVDTVGQTFSADVTWEVTLPAITTIREDSVLRELLDILEFDENQFEFTNINAMQEEREMTSSLSPAGPVHFVDSTSLAMPVKPTSEFLSHLQFGRRVVATFSEEMTLHNFPVDQQKLTLMFSTGTGVRKSLRITPAPIDAGTFNISNYKLGNVFDVVHHDKVFVGEVDTDGDKKGIRFELLLERQPEYYVTNVAIPAGIITYLCFISYAPLSDGSLMDTGDRMQIVLTLLLTAVTFKNQVASLTPQISYFTTLDQYVFFCFIIACLVAIENALFPIFADLFPAHEKWQEKGLLGISIGFFTLVNVVWGMRIVLNVKARSRASKVLIKVHEAIRVISFCIPVGHREKVLREYLKTCNYHERDLPNICSTESGYLYVQLPNDAPPHTEIEDTRKLHASSRVKAEKQFDTFKTIYEKVNPNGSPLKSFATESEKPLRAAKPNEAFEAGHRERRISAAAPLPAVVRAAALMRANTQRKYTQVA